MKLTDNVYVETEYQGANVGYVTTKRGIVMIESPQLPSDAISWRMQMQGKGEIVCLIHTEGHHDHISGDFFFDVPVICHEKSRETIMSTDIRQIKETVARMDPQGIDLVKDYRINTPVVTFTESLTLRIGDHTFILMNTPGHTAGQTAVLIPEERIVFTGDNVVYQTPAFLHEALPDAWISSLQKIKLMDVDHIVPGHGATCTPDYLEEWPDYLNEWFDKVKQAIQNGWSKEESIESITPPSRYPITRGEDFIKMMVKMNVSHLYDVFSSQEPR